MYLYIYMCIYTYVCIDIYANFYSRVDSLALGVEFVIRKLCPNDFSLNRQTFALNSPLEQLKLLCRSYV